MDDGLRSSTSLEGLDISDNMLSGNIPNWIGNISTLRVLLMSKNYLEANIPVQLSHLRASPKDIRFYSSNFNLLTDVANKCIEKYNLLQKTH